MNEVIEMQEPASGSLAQMAATAPAAVVTPIQLLQRAMESGADLDRLERLMDLQDRFLANEARIEFAKSMAAFNEVPPNIYKDKHVSFKTDKGRTEYDHATIGNVVEVVKSAAAKHGFSHRWRPTQADGQIIVECIVTHRLGHEQITRLQASPDASGGKNGIQSIMSAKTYLERHTLLAAYGLATKDQPDDDGAAAGAPDAPEPTRALPVLNEKGFLRAKAAILAAEFTVEQIRKLHVLTDDQDAALADAQAEVRK